ncbi:MAG TPA: OsmC family protein [Cytophagaceae bacterium]|jgi:putative redox protein
MIIDLERKNNAFHFEATNESGVKIQIDASPAIGGENKGARPMELLIMGLGGCSAIDILNILYKQKVTIESMRIKIDAAREADVTPSLFNNIHITYYLKGQVDRNKAERAVNLSLDKYCSVAKTLEKTATISYDLVLE